LKGGYIVKKLGKKSNITEMSIEAFVCGCSCSCTACDCTGDISSSSSKKSNGGNSNLLKITSSRAVK